MDNEKLLIVYKNNTPIEKYYVKSTDTLPDIKNDFRNKYPGYRIDIYSGKSLLQPYNFHQITNGIIILTPLPARTVMTRQRDTDYLVSQDLNDRDLLNLCIANPDLVICKDDNFWRERLLIMYGPVEKLENKTWKTLYLQLVYYTDKSEDPDQGMALAARGGHRDLVDYFISQGANYWSMGMLYAAEGGHRDLVDFFISRGARDWNSGMVQAALGGHRELVDFFIARGANNWGLAKLYAAEEGHSDLVEFFDEKIIQ